MLLVAALAADQQYRLQQPLAGAADAAAGEGDDRGYLSSRRWLRKFDRTSNQAFRKQTPFV